MSTANHLGTKHCLDISGDGSWHTIKQDTGYGDKDTARRYNLRKATTMYLCLYMSSTVDLSFMHLYFYNIQSYYFQKRKVKIKNYIDN